MMSPLCRRSPKSCRHRWKQQDLIDRGALLRRLLRDPHVQPRPGGGFASRGVLGSSVLLRQRITASHTIFLTVQATPTLPQTSRWNSDMHCGNASWPLVRPCRFRDVSDYVLAHPTTSWSPQP